MPDLSGISAALISLKTATEIVSILRKSDVSLEKAEIKMKLADLISALADAKIEIAKVQEIILEKENVIKKLEDHININKIMKYEAPYYWLIKDNVKDGPYCQKCFDKEKLMIRLQDYTNGHWGCRSCDNTYDSNPNRTHQTKAITDFNPHDY